MLAPTNFQLSHNILKTSLVTIALQSVNFSTYTARNNDHAVSHKRQIRLIRRQNKSWDGNVVAFAKFAGYLCTKLN